MFVAAKKSSNKKSLYIQVVHSYRDKLGKNKQKVVKHFGTSSINDLNKIKFLKNKANNFIKDFFNNYSSLNDFFASSHNNIKQHPFEYPIKGHKYPVPSSDKISSFFLAAKKSVSIGFHDIFGAIFNKIGFNKFFNLLNLNKDDALNFNLILKNIILARIAKPASKKSSVKFINDFFNIDIPLNDVYKMMDFISDDLALHAQKIAFKFAKKLTGSDIKIALYDVTTLYFESFTERDLMANGYSKDCKFNQPQVVLGLITTIEGLPIGYKVFSGNKYEGHTLKDIIDDAKKVYNLTNLTVIADSGILNSFNIEYLESMGYNYILGSRIKNKSKLIKQQILEIEKYKSFKNFEGLKYLKLSEGSKSLIVTHSIKRAEKDRHDRNKAIEKLILKLNNNSNATSLISNYGYKKYIEIEGSHTIKMNEKKLEEESKWDGLHGIETNIKDVNIEEAIKNYKNLWIIEESFRINKNDLSIRPIFHWTEKRIKSHICILFMTFCCVRSTLYILEKSGIKTSLEVLKDNLLKVNGSILYEANNDKSYYLPTEISQEIKSIYSCLNLKPIEKIKRLKL